MYLLISLNVQCDMYNLVIVFLTWSVSADKFNCEQSGYSGGLNTLSDKLTQEGVYVSVCTLIVFHMVFSIWYKKLIIYLKTFFFFFFLNSPIPPKATKTTTHKQSKTKIRKNPKKNLILIKKLFNYS